MTVFKRIIFLAVLSIFSVFLFSQESDEDDLDFLFETDAEDVYIEQSENEAQTAPVITTPSVFNFSGNLDSVLLGGLLYNEKINPAGYLEFSNDLILTVKPNPYLNINGCLNVSLDKSFNLALSYLYFDYLLLDRIYISMGKKEQKVGGYTRLITESALNDTSGNINIDVKIPWSTGTVFAFLSWNLNGLNMSEVYKDYSNLTERMTYAVEFEQTLLKTSINLFFKYYSQAEKVNKIRKNPVIGIEAKRSFWGFDAYVQCIAGVKDFKKMIYKDGYDRISGIAGFYKLWDYFEQNIGVNLEYQVVWSPNMAAKINHKIVLQAGINHLGKNKNLKVAVDGTHNIVNCSGTSKVALVTGGLIPYADWVNAIELEYEKNIKFIPKIMTGISIDLSY